MSQTLQETNKALVLEAFDTLFNEETMLLPNAIGLRTISSIVLISTRAAKVCSISSEAFHPR